jgi:hypothetical protein
VFPWWNRYLREIEFDSFSELLGVDGQHAIGSPGYGRISVEVNGGRHDKAIVVIRMLADQVHSPRSTEYRACASSVNQLKPF